MRFLRLFFSLILALVFLSLATTTALASLVVVDSKGKVIIKVLSVEDSVELEIPRRDFLEIKDIADETPDPEAKISLAKIDGKVSLKVSTSSGEKSLDVTSYKEEIVEIEERPEVERLTISVFGDKFRIGQKGVYAETDYQINIDPKSAGLTLATPSGFRYLSVLPKEAAETILRSRVVNRIGAGSVISLSEHSGELYYEVAGERVINVFNIFEYPVPVSARVSASTGAILSVEQPTWLKVLGFLFV